MPSAPRRRRRRMRAGTCATVLALLLPAALLPATPAAAEAAPRVTVVPQRDGLLRPGDALDLDVVVTNAGSAALPAGSVGIGLDPAPPAGGAELTDRLPPPPPTRDTPAPPAH